MNHRAKAKMFYDAAQRVFKHYAEVENEHISDFVVRNLSVKSHGYELYVGLWIASTNIELADPDRQKNCRCCGRPL